MVGISVKMGFHTVWGYCRELRYELWAETFGRNRWIMISNWHLFCYKECRITDGKSYVVAKIICLLLSACHKLMVKRMSDVL